MSAGRSELEDNVLAYFLLRKGILDTAGLAAARAEVARRPGTRLLDAIRMQIADETLAPWVRESRLRVRPCPTCSRSLVAVDAGPATVWCRTCHAPTRTVAQPTPTPPAATTETSAPVPGLDLTAVIDEPTEEPTGAVPLGPVAFKRGDVIAGFAVERVLGHGGMGVVLLARRPGPNEPAVALKLLIGGLSEKDVKRLEREGQSLARLDHPGIVKTLELGECDQGPYVAMEYVDGLPLSTFFAKAGLTNDQALAICEETARAIDHAHRRGVVHRDLKPSNVLITRDRRVKIVDFGLAKDMDGGSSLTETGAVLGTPFYMSPELIRGPRAAVGASTDVYAVGVMLYELTTGTVPFQDPHPIDLFRAIVNAPVEPPTRRRADLPLSAELDKVVLHALDKEPTRRYASALDLAEDIARLRRGEPVAARASDVGVHAGMRIGEFEVLAEIGRGPIGTVFRARGADGRDLALKALRGTGAAALLGDVAELRELRDEHGFVPIVDALEHASGAVVVTPVMPGGNLRERLERGPLSVAETLELAKHVAAALGVAHARGIVHGDVKPENILCAADGRPLLSDAGVARHFASDVAGGAQVVTLKKDGQPAGVCGYMAPEQLAADARRTPASDVFALGAVLWECLAGKPAFRADNVLPMVSRIGMVAVQPIERVRGETPPWLAELIAKCLARDPDARPKDGAELARALAAEGARGGALGVLGKLTRRLRGS